MSSLFGMFERRSLENPSIPLTPSALMEWLGESGQGDAGVNVTARGSLAMSAVWRATALISGVSAALPLKAYETGTRTTRRSLMLENPHPDMTPLEFWRLSYVHRCLWGNFYAQKVRNRGGQLQWLQPIGPDRVRVAKVRPSAANPSGKLFDIQMEDGKHDVFTPSDIFHVPGMGYDGLTGCSPIRVASQGIGLGLAAETYGARLFGSGNLMSGILQTEQRLQQSDAEALQKKWQAKVAGLGRSHEVAVIDSGAKFQSLTMPNTDAQFLESRRFQTSEVGRFFGVPPFLMGDTEKSTSWGTGLEQQATGWVKFDLNPQWLAPTEQRITKELTGPGIDAKYTVQGLLRGDSTARSNFYNVMRTVGALSANDIRELEDMPGIGPDGDTFLQPLNMAPLGAEATTPTTEDDQ